MIEEQSKLFNHLDTIRTILDAGFLGRLIIFSMIGGLYLCVSSLIAETTQPWFNFFQGWIFSLSILIIAISLNLIIFELKIWKFVLLIIGIANLILWVLYFLSSSTLLAWIVIALSYALFIRIGSLLSAGRGRFLRFILDSLFALGIGLCTIALVQMETNFAEEEFFSAIQAFVVAGYWLVLRTLDKILERVYRRRKSELTFINRLLLLGVLCSSLIVGSIIFIRSYQLSFYPNQVPTYTGINSDAPFECGQLQPDTQIYDGQEVFDRILQSLESNPHKSSPEYGMLAVGSGKNFWAEKFRESILEEARHGLYTEPAGSVKYGQYEATFRAYYYSRILERFPDLFSSFENKEIRDWFAAINRRALTVELVDWLYAIAFSKRPEGPYENQETGVGLLGLLESQGLADPKSTVENQDYLSQNLSGWMQRFRNTDDAAVYQPEWINNAYYQSLYSKTTNYDNIRLSFEWLLLQALPNGAPLRYNHIGSASFESLAYLGAKLLGDDRFIWLSGRALDYKNERGNRIFPQPGVEKPTDLMGKSPSEGSCLLFGGSGLPNQIGPLAPDKIVFRNGWASDSAYLLLNLRFTGWHRYKATNTVTLLYQNGNLASDQMSEETFSWLPVGRSLFRDKRIPRENLNGFIVDKVGLSRILYELTGLGSPWAQDPPYYAEVEEFTTGKKMDSSTTMIEDWHGWTHNRSILFHHEGPIVVIDDAWGPERQTAGLSWNLISDEILDNHRIQLRTGDNPAQVVFVPVSSGEFETFEITSAQKDVPNVQVQYLSNDGYISLITIFLTEDWGGGQTQLTQGEDGLVLEIITDNEYLELPLSGFRKEQ